MDPTSGANQQFKLETLEGLVEVMTENEFKDLKELMAYDPGLGPRVLSLGSRAEGSGFKVLGSWFEA